MILFKKEKIIENNLRLFSLFVNLEIFLNYEKLIWKHSEMEFKEFEQRFKSAKPRFKFSAGLNFETFDTILSGTNNI